MTDNRCNACQKLGTLSWKTLEDNLE